MLNLSGLPNLWQEPRRYTAAVTSRRVWRVERWWWREAHLELRRVLEAAREGYVRSPAWSEIADLAGQAIIRLGAWGAKQECAIAKRRGRAATPRLRTVQMAEEPVPGQVSWERWPGETWEQYKARVFTPLHDSMFGVPTAFCERYVAKHLPLIRGAEEETRRRVQQIVDQAQREWLTDKEYQAKLQAAGNWPLARVRTQIRTETSNLYNAGRYAYMESDEAVVGYEYVVTLDGRTTDLCKALAGKRVRAGELKAVPPLHFNCRTVLAPVFDFDRGFAWDRDVPAPGEGLYQGASYKGFGQPALVEEFRGAKGVGALRPVRVPLTASEVQTWAREKVPEVDWQVDALDPGISREVVQALIELKSKAPRLTEQLGRVTTSGDLGEYWAEADDMIIGEGRHRRHGVSIALNRDLTADELKEAMREAVEQGWHAPGTDSIGALLTHELGHGMEREPALMAWAKREHTAALREWVPMAERAGKKWNHYLSEYALESPGETLAEAITTYYHTPRQAWPAPVKRFAKIWEALP